MKYDLLWCILQARKLEEHRRKKERKASEKKDRERQERLKKAQEASKARDDNTRPSQPSSDGDFYQFLNDPDVLQSFQVCFFLSVEKIYYYYLFNN